MTRDYTKQIAEFWPTIMQAWKEHAEKHPVIECDLASMTVAAYPSRDYIDGLSERTREATHQEFNRVVGAAVSWSLSETARSASFNRTVSRLSIWQKTASPNGCSGRLTSAAEPQRRSAPWRYHEKEKPLSSNLHSAVSKGWSEEFPLFLTVCLIGVYVFRSCLPIFETCTTQSALFENRVARRHEWAPPDSPRQACLHTSFSPLRRAPSAKRTRSITPTPGTASIALPRSLPHQALSSMPYSGLQVFAALLTFCWTRRPFLATVDVEGQLGG